MKKICKATSVFFSLVILSAGLFGCGGGNTTQIGNGALGIDDDFACTITVDGGGQWANYNTTPNMTESDSNPYPYNTLEKLISEYTALHPKVKIELLSNSYNGARDQILPMLTTSTAPDILFQVPTCLAEDCNKGYYAPLDEYLNEKNPYSAAGEKGSARWGDIFGTEEYKPTVDGHYYYAAMDRSALGIVYNKTFFSEHGISVPATYSEFLECIEEIHTADASVVPYTANGGNMWMDIVIESAVFYGLKDRLDVVKQDGRIDAQEIIKGYKEGIIDPEGEYYQEYMRLISLKTKYSVNPQNTVLKNEFMLGGVIMGEADGNTIAYLMNSVKNFEVGVFPYPVIDKEVSEYVAEGTATRRGSSGLSTAWFITNHAFNSENADENRKKVNACVDFLMFLTAKSNNDRMVNDKKVAIPLSGNGYGKNDCFKPLVEQYNEDLENENFYGWAYFNPSGSLTKSYYDQFYIAYHDYMYGNTAAANKGNTKVFARAIVNGLDAADVKLSRLNGWNY